MNAIALDNPKLWGPTNDANAAVLRQTLDFSTFDVFQTLWVHFVWQTMLMKRAILMPLETTVSLCFFEFLIHV